MDEVDSHDIWQQILRLKILDTDSDSPSVIGNSAKQAEIAPDDELNLDDDDIATLAAAIGKFDIEDGMGTEGAKPKPKRGRPKKRVIQRKARKPAPMVPVDRCNQTNPHTNTNVHQIRATISPLPEHLAHRANMVQHGQHNAEFLRTLCDDHQRQREVEVEEVDPTEIMTQIMASGILNWNSQESLAATQRPDESVNNSHDIEAWESDVENDKSIDHPKDKRPRRPRGRPARRAKRPKQMVKVSTQMSPLPQQLQSNLPRPIIRATSDPVQDFRQQAMNHEVLYQPDSGDIDGNDDNQCRGDGELSHHSSKIKRPRGRPKRRKARAAASQRQLMDDSQFTTRESENRDNKGTQEDRPRSPTPSETLMHDDEYRPTPPPPPTVRSPSLQVSPHTTAELTPTEIASRAMARPVFWTSVLDTWRTLGSKEWLEATVADFYLTHVWYEMTDRSRMRYVDLHTSMVPHIAEEELALFRRNNFLPREGICPVVPVGFIVHHAHHFFVVIFDYQQRTAHIMGRHISFTTLQVEGVDPHSWSDWNGPEYWRRIAVLHGWSTGDVADVSIRTRDWLQNGVDCGPIACSVLEQCLKLGLDEHGNLPEVIMQCGHILRIKMLGMLSGRVKLSCSDYLLLLDKPQDDWGAGDMPEEDIIRMIQNNRLQDECLKLLRKLMVLSATCSSCQRPELVQDDAQPSYDNRHDHLDATAFNQPTLDMEHGHEEEEDEEDFQGTTLPADRKAHLAVLFKTNKQLSGSRNRNSIIARAVATHLQLEPVEAPPGQDTIDSQRSEPATATRRRVKNWNLGSNKRFPRPVAPLALDAYSGSRWLKDDHTFDDYEGGPTIEMLLTPRDIDPTMTFQTGGLRVSTAWIDWVDHGYRITPSSFHIFYQCDPIATMDHIMPTGTTDSYDPSNQVPDRVTGQYSLERNGSNREGRHTSVTDVEIFSASDLIDSAHYDPPLHDECRAGCNAFVRGRTSHRFRDGPPLYVDLERDAVKFSAEEIEISVDIDSIIWTTKTFRCRGSVGIYITPPFQTKPGIFKHNHTYVDITIPQSEDDANTPGGRTEWLSKRFPMSAIPHVCIGRITSASSTLNLYIAFPRMIHQHPTNGRRITLMPKEVLDIFWDRVLLPSIGDCTDVSWAPYLKHTLEEARYKARGADGRKGGWGAPKAIPLSDDDFRDVQDRMAGRIRDGEGELSMYGSLFFILEGKGIKLLTKDGQRKRFSGPEEALRRNLSDLDWPYMMDRKHGELLVDVGVSFTPQSPDVPVVGVWRLDALEASFGAGGYKRGEMHHHNTLSRYGALQAEMQQERCQQTHIAFRSTYNLYYESIRTNSNQANFASDSDAYKLSPSYMAECAEIAKVVEGCKEKTYGVRDEYRVSGHAARIILKNVEDKARDYLNSDPVLWIPSKIWFELLRRRVREIQRTQISIVKKNPPNLGVLTGLLNHMLRSTTSTPIIYDSHVRESLALLEYRNILETAGMFFLQDFDINSDTCLDEVQQIDDVHVLALMGVNAKAQRDRAVRRMDAWQSTESELEDYPLGRTPTWTQLKATIANSPAMIMRPWTWSPRLSNTQLSVERLVVKFTQHMWLMLAPEVFKSPLPHPTSLQEAMKCWTVTSIDDTLAAVAFEACNVGLHDNTGVTPGRMGPKSRSFLDRCTLFFPDPDAAHKDNSQWSTLWEGEGYIAEFHRTMKTMDEDQQELVKQGLREVFADLHCLPASGARVWTQKNDAIVFTTNPIFYKIDYIGRGGESQRRAPRAGRTMKVIKGKRIFAADLMDSQPFDADGNLRRKTERQKRREIQKKMTLAKKNKRVPPPPRPRRPFPMTQLQDIAE